MKQKHPDLVFAFENGEIASDDAYYMLCRRGDEWALPRPDELIPLPHESEFFLLPGRKAVGLNKETGEVEELEELAVAAFVSPGYTISGHPVYVTEENAPTLPLFAYGALGVIGDEFYVCAMQVDKDPRQVFEGISPKKIEKKAKALIKEFPDNRLMQHLMHNCVLRYGCPAAKNLVLGRYEAPLPTSKACNARCVGCISQQEADSSICRAPQDRMNFTPTAQEIAEVMLYHQQNEPEPIYSFGQGCEGEPLTQGPLLAEAVKLFREKGGKGTVNLNSNASMPKWIKELALAGLNSLRVSMNSARESVYNRYYRPTNYSFSDVRESIKTAKEHGLFVSLNLLFFPGITDCEEEVEALIELVNAYKVDFIQLRNLNIDPEMYLRLLDGIEFGPSVGLANFTKRLLQYCPHLHFGYFNPKVQAPSLCTDLHE